MEKCVCVNYVCSICLDTFYLVLSFHPFLSFISSFIEVNLDHPSPPAACHHYVFPGLVSLWTVSHLHHDAEVFDVIFLRLNQLIENKPERKEGGHECSGGKCREPVQ